MQAKRQRPPGPEDDSARRPPTKRLRLSRPPTPATPRPLRRRTGPDLLSALSDELLVRILSFLSLPHLLAVAPASRRLDRLAADNQLWKALYYGRFVLPRAMRIPGFRGDGRGAAAGGGHKLHYSGRRTLWADGRRGGVVARETPRGLTGYDEGRDGAQHDRVNWKRQYKLRHNWARGKCAVEELRIGSDEPAEAHGDYKMLVKVVEGVAITADRASGLRAWDLKTREIMACVSFGGEDEQEAEDPAPSCLAVDERELDDMAISVAVGFLDGSFGVWRLDIRSRRLERQYRHEKSINGELIGMALSYPYLLTATESVLVSLYTFQIPSNETDGRSNKEEEEEEEVQCEPRWRLETPLQENLGGVPMAGENGESRKQEGMDDDRKTKSRRRGNILPAPYLLTSLKSHTSRPPLALSIRKTAATTIASIAYTFSTRQGWSIGLQDLHIKHASAGLKSAPEITTTRLAYTTPIDSGFSPAHGHPSPTATPRRRHERRLATLDPPRPSSPPSSPPICSSALRRDTGPTTLCYTHPYLLATLPDNTLVLHLCTSTAESLDVSPGIRLWGHTSGVSGAEITARGKAVSVCERGDEMRVWELEGRAAGLRGGGRSVEIRPGLAASPPREKGLALLGREDGDEAERGWDERRNWVGFDDEMVIVLKETKGGRESLMVYDFT